MCLIFSIQGYALSLLTSEQGIILIVDNSGSLGDTINGEREWSVAEDWLQNVAIKGKKYYLENKDLESVDMGLVQFGGTCQAVSLSELGASKSSIKKNLEEIKPYPHLNASTAILESISRAIDLLGKKRSPKIALFTDMGENCIKVENQCTLVKRMEDVLSQNKVKLDLALVGYGVNPSLSPTAQGFPGFPGLDCMKNSKYINLKYFDAGRNGEFLDKATQDSLDFLKGSGVSTPAPIPASQCQLSIFCHSPITVTIGTIVLVFPAWSFRKRISKFLSIILVYIGNGLIAFGKAIKQAGQKRSD
jgi:von Willebrand factor type A domain